MAQLTKSLLVLSVLGLSVGLALVAGAIPVGNAVAWYVILPFGAVFLGLFLISRMLEKETALFDQDHNPALGAQPALAGSSSRR